MAVVLQLGVGALYYGVIAGRIYRATYNTTDQAIVVSQTHPWVSEGRATVFSVRLAVAPAADVPVTVAFSAGSSDVSVASGAFLVFTPANWDQIQNVVVAAADDADVITDLATLTVSAPGLPAEAVEVRVVDNSGAFGGAIPGRIADGGLTVTKSVLTPGEITLAWPASCAPEGLDFAVHEGTIGSWYSHGAVLCSTGGATTASLPPGAGDRYYLVVPMSAAREGSYGVDSAGAERPRPGNRCRTERDTTACP
jgi:hypothetical protein